MKITTENGYWRYMKTRERLEELEICMQITKQEKIKLNTIIKMLEEYENTNKEKL